MSRPKGKWSFSFNYEKKELLKVRKYQALLMELRQTYEPKFAQMKAEEGEIEWTARTDGKAPSDNMFCKFSYKCTRLHQDQGPEHGTWYLLWNPKKAKVDNHLNARCAPDLFKQLSNEIQKKLCKEFSDHFQLNWENGISGYGDQTEAGGGYSQLQFGGGGRGRGRQQTNYNALFQAMQALNDMRFGDHDDESGDYCPHNRGWAFCRSCNGGGWD